jgi:uncharacterized protein with NAD-binding domain and iron-sulfur cluster
VDKGHLHGRPGAPQHLAFSVTPEEAARDRSNAKWAALALRALEAAIARRAVAAGVAPAQVPACQRAVVLREPAAYYPCDAESSRARAAAAATTVEGLFLAGDWTEPDLPACIEGAVRSGLRAAASAGGRG